MSQTFTSSTPAPATSVATAADSTSPDYKHALQSKTIWGVLLLIVGAVLQKLSAKYPGLASVNPDDVLSYLVQAAGSAFAVYGRFTAKQPISLLPVSKAGAKVAALLAIAVVCVAALGCSLTPVSAADKTVLSLTVAEQAMTSAVQAHEITPAQAEAVLPYLEAARSAKDTMVAAANAGDTGTYTAAAAALQSALTTFNAQLAAAKAAAPATRPSSSPQPAPK